MYLLANWKNSDIGKTQSQCAYSALTHGLANKWNFMMRVTDLDKHEISDKLLQLEDTISRKFISNITGQPAPGEFLRELFTLPARYGGLGIENPVLSAKEHHTHCVRESAPIDFENT